MRSCVRACVHSCSDSLSSVCWAGSSVCSLRDPAALLCRGAAPHTAAMLPGREPLGANPSGTTSGHHCCGWKCFMETAVMVRSARLPAEGESSGSPVLQQHRAWVAEEHPGCRAWVVQCPGQWEKLFILDPGFAAALMALRSHPELLSTRVSLCPGGISGSSIPSSAGAGDCGSGVSVRIQCTGRRKQTLDAVQHSKGGTGKAWAVSAASSDIRAVLPAF